MWSASRSGWFTPWERVPLPNGKEAEWAPEPVLTRQRREKYPHPAHDGNRSPVVRPLYWLSYPDSPWWNNYIALWTGSNAQHYIDMKIKFRSVAQYWFFFWRNFRNLDFKFCLKQGNVSSDGLDETRTWNRYGKNNFECENGCRIRYSMKNWWLFKWSRNVLLLWNLKIRVHNQKSRCSLATGWTTAVQFPAGAIIENFLFAYAFRPALGLTHHPTRGPYPRIERPGRKADQSLSCSANVKKCGHVPPFPLRLHRMFLN